MHLARSPPSNVAGLLAGGCWTATASAPGHPTQARPSGSRTTCTATARNARPVGGGVSTALDKFGRSTLYHWHRSVSSWPSHCVLGQIRCPNEHQGVVLLAKVGSLVVAIGRGCGVTFFCDGGTPPCICSMSCSASRLALPRSDIFDSTSWAYKGHGWAGTNYKL